ncbi:MAG: hypothetical protein SNJ75_05815 [Gemmataceae bacterium]
MNPLPPSAPWTRLRLRLLQISTTLLTLLATVYCCTLGPIPAILALSVAKHVLVAVLMMGLQPLSPNS